MNNDSFEHPNEIINLEPNNQETSSPNDLNGNIDANRTALQKLKYFWLYSKPCGILTLVVGIVSILASTTCFIIVYGTTYCHNNPKTCVISIVRLYAIIFLVVGVFILLFGTAIIVYSTRDRNSNIIRYHAKQLHTESDQDQSESKRKKKLSNRQKKKNVLIWLSMYSRNTCAQQKHT